MIITTQKQKTYPPLTYNILKDGVSEAATVFGSQQVSIRCTHDHHNLMPPATAPDQHHQHHQHQQQEEQDTLNESPQQQLDEITPSLHDAPESPSTLSYDHPQELSHDHALEHIENTTNQPSESQ